MQILKKVDKNSKIIIYGAGTIAKAVVKILKKNELTWSRIVGCAVTSINYNDYEIDGIKVYKAEDVLSAYRDAYVIIAVRDMYRKDVVSVIEKMGITQYDYIDIDECIELLEQQMVECEMKELVSCFAKYSHELDKEEYLLFLSKQLSNSVLNFEVNVVDHCNLNCQSCNHFSPIAEKKFLDCEEYERDLERVALITRGKIGTLMLLGGEPLLHPDIIAIMQISRKHLKNTEISIVSNGILLGKQDDIFWKECRELEIHIVLTKYPINLNYEELKERASAEGVSLSFAYASQELKTLWHLPLKEQGGLNGYINYMKCYYAKRCVVLRSGRLYTCPISAYVHFFNKYFDKQMPEKNVNSIGIYEEDAIGKIYEFLSKPIPMCEHCDVANYQYDVPWCVSKRQLSEWT